MRITPWLYENLVKPYPNILEGVGVYLYGWDNEQWSSFIELKRKGWITYIVTELDIPIVWLTPLGIDGMKKYLEETGHGMY